MNGGNVNKQKKLRKQTFNSAFFLMLGVQDVSLESRPFLAALFQFLDHSDNDYIQLFALCLVYSMQVKNNIQNRGVCFPKNGQVEKYFFIFPPLLEIIFPLVDV